MEIKEKVRRYIEYDGYRFYEDQKNYWIGQVLDADGKPHRKRLHIYVWEKYNGPVPEGFHVHHIDRDTSNNEIENLVALPESEHLRLHASLQDKEKLKQYLDECARPKAIEWHKSRDGEEWHKVQYEKSIRKYWDETVTLKCQYCGKEYKTSVLMCSKSRFCSNKCKTAFRYHAGLDNIERECVICGSRFTANKYSRVKTCSKECANKLMSNTKREGYRRKK